MISKRKLRFVQFTPPLAVCEYCSTQFSGSEGEIRQQFQSHKCERHDEDGAHTVGAASADY
jgi:hypothetical protein